METEVHRSWVTALFTTDTDLEVAVGLTTPLHTGLDQLANALLINGLERICCEDTLVEVVLQEAADVITAEAEGHLRQVVGAEGEELSNFCHAVCKQGRAWDLDHGAVGASDAFADICAHVCNDAVVDIFGSGQLGDVTSHRDHDLRLSIGAFVLQLCSSFEDGTNLHLGDGWVGDAQTHAAMAHHWVHFMQICATLGDVFCADPECFAQACLAVSSVGDELMQWRIEQAKGHGVYGAMAAIVDLTSRFDEDCQGVDSLLARCVVSSHDDLAEAEQRVVCTLTVEHVLGTK